MQKAFEEVFNGLISDLNTTIQSHVSNELADSTALTSIGRSGTKEFTFHLDGQCSQQFSAYGAGRTLNYTLTILNPDAIYNITIHCSDGGGGEYTNVSINQPMSGVLKTSFWHSTTLTLTVEANVTTIDVTARLEYNY